MDILVWMIVVFVAVVAWAWFSSKEKPEPSKPPTDKQKRYIRVLLKERKADDLAKVKPSTIDQASDLIDKLHNRPRRPKE